MAIEVGKVYITHATWGVRLKVTRIKGNAVYYQHIEPGITDTREYSIPMQEMEDKFFEQLNG